MGLLAPEDWQARWLNDGRSNPIKDEDFYQDDPAPLLRKEFVIARKVVRARLYISGLGYYEASLNGGRVGNQVLDPGWTRYSACVLYSAHDVTAQLRAGTNCLGVTLGNGWYNPLPLRFWGSINLREHLTTGRPRFIARLEMVFEDGTRQTVVSDPTWKVGRGPSGSTTSTSGRFMTRGESWQGGTLRASMIPRGVSRASRPSRSAHSARRPSRRSG